jgi:hypothetical protein
MNEEENSNGKDAVKLAPSILAADFARVLEQDRIHVDVMDGHFVPNLSMGALVVRSLRRVTRLPLEAHLMISNPDLFVDEFAQAGTDSFLVHWEVQQRSVAHSATHQGVEKRRRRRHQLGNLRGRARRSLTGPRSDPGHDREPGIRPSAFPPHDAAEDHACARDDRSPRT